jgi:hypothetical protein
VREEEEGKDQMGNGGEEEEGREERGQQTGNIGEESDTK